MIRTQKDFFSNLKDKLKNAVAEDARHIKSHRSLLFVLSKETDERTSVHRPLQDLGSAEDEETVEEAEKAERDQGEQKSL